MTFCDVRPPRWDSGTVSKCSVSFGRKDAEWKTSCDLYFVTISPPRYYAGILVGLVLRASYFKSNAMSLFIICRSSYVLSSAGWAILHSGNSALSVQCIWTRWWIYRPSSQSCVMDPCVRVWLRGVSWGAPCVSWPLWELVGCMSAWCSFVAAGIHRYTGHRSHSAAIIHRQEVEVDNALAAATAGARTARGSSIWLASGNQGDSGLPVCVTDNVANTHLYTWAHE